MSPSSLVSSICGLPTACKVSFKRECFKFVKVEAVHPQKLDNLTSATFYWQYEPHRATRGGGLILSLGWRSSKEPAAIFTTVLQLWSSLLLNPMKTTHSVFYVTSQVLKCSLLSTSMTTHSSGFPDTSRVILTFL